MAVCGLPQPNNNHAGVMAQLAVKMLSALENVNREEGTSLQIRVGLHSGRVVAGVIGKKKFAYDLWGDTVNTASRMEFHGSAGRIHLSPTTAALLGPAVTLEDRGEIEIKGKGPMRCYFLKV
jgi:class 3 adenylate cyclase